MKPNFTKPFILDVVWFTYGEGTILSQKDGQSELMIAIYVNKRLSPMQKKFHPMEGKFYVLLWGILHF